MHVGQIAGIETSPGREKLVDSVFLKFTKSRHSSRSAIGQIGILLDDLVWAIERLLGSGSQTGQNDRAPAFVDCGDLAGDRRIRTHQPQPLGETLPFEHGRKIEAVVKHEVTRVAGRPYALQRKSRSEGFRRPLEAILLKGGPVNSAYKMVFLAYGQRKSFSVRPQELHQRT